MGEEREGYGREVESKRGRGAGVGWLAMGKKRVEEVFALVLLKRTRVGFLQKSRRSNGFNAELSKYEDLSGIYTASRRDFGDSTGTRTSFLDPVLCLVEALSTIDCGLETIFPNKELCHLVCRVIKLPEKYEALASGNSVPAGCGTAGTRLVVSKCGEKVASERGERLRKQSPRLAASSFANRTKQRTARNGYTSSCVSAVVIIANLLLDGKHIASQLSQEKSSLIMDYLDGHYMEYSNPQNGSNTGAILMRIACIIDEWYARKNEKIEETADIVDSDAKVRRLLHYCNKYSSLLSSPKVQE
ncbi:hypothetical protein IEQ34_016131 [Dendrobium chrysotoxum]|uniref:Uncharacterized protein n=1 Tax=Dendrobium chrysotoxum TaxID=161865 RepID=A0AAV7GEG5_DENCH|nr:hypothetical protein IEQ34_016131 [Dendrobium chrysotoxum]